MDAKRKALERSERRDLFRKVEKLFPPNFVRRATRNGAGRRAAGEGGRSEIDVLTDLVGFVAALKQKRAERPVRREAAAGLAAGVHFRDALFSSGRLLCLEVVTDTGIILATGRGADRVLGPAPWVRCDGHSIRHLVHLADFQTLALMCEGSPAAPSGWPASPGPARAGRRAAVRLACFTRAPGFHAEPCRQVCVFRYISFDLQVLPIGAGRALLVASIPLEFESYNGAAASPTSASGCLRSPLRPKLERERYKMAAASADVAPSAAAASSSNGAHDPRCTAFSKVSRYRGIHVVDILARRFFLFLSRTACVFLPCKCRPLKMM